MAMPESPDLGVPAPPPPPPPHTAAARRASAGAAVAERRDYTSGDRTEMERRSDSL